MFRPDPVLGWALTPLHGVTPAFRKDIVQRIDADGWRFVPGRPADGPRVGLYGCSFTYGTGLADTETFSALLQQARPGLRVVNRGIGGHGTVQNLLQMRRDIAAGAVDAVLFLSIADHRFRVVPHPSRMRAFLNVLWYELGVEHVPVARHAPDGTLRIVYVPIWQPGIKDGRMDAFLPDDHLLIRTVADVLSLARTEAQAAGLRWGAAVLDQVQPEVTQAMLGLIPGLVDASVPYDTNYHLLPKDTHPSARGAARIADRLLPLLDRVTEGLGA
ncbi:hypothetical protein N9W17_02845 [Jannaschia sp.]|nr:hypothetical protein [Jannaschia sp.]